MKTQVQTPSTAVTVWSKDIEAQVKSIISSGASVPKAMMKVAPKGFVAGLRSARKAQLIEQTPVLFGGFTRDGFRIESMGAVRELKNGVKTCTVRLATAKPTSSMTLAEFAKAEGISVEDIRAAISMRQ